MAGRGANKLFSQVVWFLDFVEDDIIFKICKWLFKSINPLLCFQCICVCVCMCVRKANFWYAPFSRLYGNELKSEKLVHLTPIISKMTNIRTLV